MTVFDLRLFLFDWGVGRWAGYDCMPIQVFSQDTLIQSCFWWMNLIVITVACTYLCYFGLMLCVVIVCLYCVIIIIVIIIIIIIIFIIITPLLAWLDHNGIVQGQNIGWLVFFFLNSVDFVPPALSQHLKLNHKWILYVRGNVSDGSACKVVVSQP